MTLAPWEMPHLTPDTTQIEGVGALEHEIEMLYADQSGRRTKKVEATLAEFRQALNRGTVRAANFDGKWRVNAWVKKALTLHMRFGTLLASDGVSIDLDTLPRKQFSVADGVRVTDGTCFVRDGVCVSEGCTLMPNTIIQMGAFVGPRTTVGGGTGIGVCAQIGAHVQIGAGVQIYGNIEPLDALPAIIGDGASIGANCVVGTSVIIGPGAFIFPGTVLLQQSRVYDPCNKQRITSKDGEPLIIPANAIVIPGARSLARKGKGDPLLNVTVPVIAGYSTEPNLPPMLLDRLIED